MLTRPARVFAVLLTLSLVGTLAASAHAAFGRHQPRVGTPEFQQRLDRVMAEGSRAAEMKRAGVTAAGRPGAPSLDAWTTDGFKVTSNAVFGQIFPQIVTDNAAGAFVAWLDFRSGLATADVFVQRINSNGDVAAGWPADGFSAAPHDSLVLDVSAAVDGAGGAYVGFSEFRWASLSNRDIFIQRVLANGTVAGGWPAAGKSLGLGDIVNFAIRSDEQGGVFAGWIDPNQQAWIQRVNNAGNVVAGWPAAGIPVGPAGVDATIDFVADGTGGFYAAWASNDSALCTRYGAGGTVAAGWAAAGNPASAGGIFIGDLALTKLTSGDVMIGFSDFRTFDLDLYAVRLTAAGGFATGFAINGLPVNTETGTLSDVIAVSDGAGGAIFTWTDVSAAPSFQTFAQRMTGAGAIASGWPVPGVPLCTAASDKFIESFVGDGAGGLFGAWYGDPASTGSTDIYATCVLSNASTPFPAAGLPVCTAVDGQYDVVITTDQGGGAILAWSDDRDPISPAHIYVARILSTGTAANASLASAIAEPGRVRLTWYTPDDVFAATVERDAGAGHVAIGTVRGGSGVLEFEDRDVTAGAAYRYRLRVDEAGGPTYLGEASVRVPTGLALAIESAQPNPSAGRLALAFTLPEAAPATLELIDVGGRRVLARDAGGAAGRRVLRLDEKLAPGVYVARLAQGGRAVSMRVVVTE